ncbi:MAG: energy transducer TonB, partial [Candidatus Cloacimonetes bacterium]|nr:energy transducer TonB [Candidatus Cloacimonadota bacterium]
LSKILADSLIVLDSLKLSMPFDSLITSQDSTDIITLEKVEFDTLEITTVATEKDSVVSINYATVDSTEYLSVIEKIKRTKQVIKSYENEFIPYSRFVKLWLYQNVTIDSIKAEIEFEKLLELGDNNKYGYAAKRLGSGEKVELTTFTEQLQKSEYEHALEDLATDPAKTLELLEPIISDSLHIFQEKAIYSNAYINYLILSDSVAAKPFVEAILENDESEYILEIKKFYDKGKFLKFDRLPYLEQLERKEEQAKAEAAEQVSQDESEALERDRKAKVLGGSTIKWPIIREASAANVIIVQVEIDESGNVGNIEVIQSLIEAKPSLDNIVIAQIKNWKFASALKDGEKVKSILELSFTYDLEKR